MVASRVLQSDLSDFEKTLKYLNPQTLFNLLIKFPIRYDRYEGGVVSFSVHVRIKFVPIVNHPGGLVIGTGGYVPITIISKKGV